MALLQVAFIVLKLAEVGKIAKWTWLSVLSLTWLPLALLVFIASVYLLYRMLPQKKKNCTYTSKGWQEKLAEVNYNRWNQ